LTGRSFERLPPLSDERLQHFVQMLGRWRKITNLTSRDNFSRIWERNIDDSLFIQRLCPGAVRWLDIGSGAGFPGVVIAVAIADRSEAEVHCVDSDSRKCAFLRAVADELGIPMKVHNQRAESLSVTVTGPIDALTARAFSSLNHILELSDEYLSSGTVAILPRGEKSRREVELIDANRYTVKINPNPGHEGGLIVVVRQKVSRANG
jgi:16S rRNA (guanine527-N7)-methyltransferase